MQGHVLTWTDHFGRSYEYVPYEAIPIGDASVDFSSDTTLAVAEASRALGSLPRLPVAGIATVLFRSEANASSLIEGLGPGPRRVLEAEIADEAEIDDQVARRVVSNLAALRDAMGTSIPARAEDILRWHDRLMEGHPRIAPGSLGAFRMEQNWIGADASGPRNAEFVPPRHEDVPTLIEDLVTFCARTDISPVAHAAIAHARFEVIHPFTDGNGRVGRMLFQQLLGRRLDLPSPVPVSVFWSRDTDKYIAGLRSYQSGDIDAWLEFASLSIIDSVWWMTEIVEATLTLLGEFRSRLRTRGESVTVRIINDLAKHPIVDAQSVAARYRVTPQSAHSALARLEKAGILSERPFARRRRGRPRTAFTASELIGLLESRVRTPTRS
jgi:Fic family protein